MDQGQFSQVIDFVQRANSILVLVPQTDNLDVLAASSSLYLFLQDLGKEATLAGPELIPSPHENLVGVDQLQTDVSNQNLVVSFKYVAEAVEKVNYHIGEETQRFYLTVEPRSGHPPLEKDSIEATYAGANADLIFLVGVHDLSTLGAIYEGNQQLFNDTPVITLHNFAPEVGNIHLTTQDYLNLSHLVTAFFQAQNTNVSPEIATNLLLSLDQDTKRFSSLSTTPNVFEAAAWLMRNGARRFAPTPQPAKPVTEAQAVAAKPDPLEKKSQIKPKKTGKRKKRKSATPRTNRRKS